MKSYFYLCGITCAVLMTSVAVAQLPANPWKISPNDGYMGDNVANTDVTQAPVYQDTTNGADILPVDPWARARDKSGIKTWRGSGQHGKLNYIGEATTFGDAQGQEMIAPEVNRHNMLVATEHLRKLGYKIPTSYDENIKNMPQDYARHLRAAYDGLGHQNNPLDTMFSGTIDVMEEMTGLDMENILFNTINVLSTD